MGDCELGGGDTITATVEQHFPFRLRSIPRPTVPLPIACRSVGHYRTFPGWCNGSYVKDFVQLFWGVAGTGVFLSEGRELRLGAGDVFVLFTGQVHHLTAVDQWEFRWLTLDGEMPDAVVKSFGIGNEPFASGPCPQELFQRLSSEIVKISPQSQRIASATAFEILSLAYRRRTEAPLATERFEKSLELIRRRYASRDFNISILAREVGVHRTSLTQLFRDNLMMTPIEYLTSFRVSRAIKLLQESDLPVRDVALRCGFSCPNYFANVVHRKVGLTPTAIRSEARHHSTNL
jgi:AraC-like DNA-binding protein